MFLGMLKQSLVLVVVLNLWLESTVGLEEDCTDFLGNIISHGNLYVPGPSVCTRCVCYHNAKQWCKAIYCDPPYFCKKFRIGENCCEFDCLDSPEEIAAEKERLRRRKKFLGITYGSASVTKATYSMYFAVIFNCILVLIF